MYRVVRKVRADFEGNAEDLNFSIHLLNLNLLRHELFGQPNIYTTELMNLNKNLF